MMKSHIIREIQRTARENGGKPLGRLRFLGETGIKEADWRGRYWARWNDALQEAGFGPNKLNPGFRAGLEGPCSYQYRRIIEKDLGWLDFGTQEESEDMSKMNPDTARRAYEALSSGDAYFVKRERHRHQVEYRFVWLTDEPITPCLEFISKRVC